MSGGAEAESESESEAEAEAFATWRLLGPRLTLALVSRKQCQTH